MSDWLLASNGEHVLAAMLLKLTLLLIAAIAVPRISRGAKGASDAALRGDLAVIRSAIDLYAAEHNGDFPTVGKFLEQLTTYTDIM